MIFIVSFSFLNCFTYFPLKGLFKINLKKLNYRAYQQIWSFYYLRWLRLLFLAAQFGIWIGMVRHSAEFYFSVSDFVSFSQFHFSYFVLCFRKNFSLELLVVILIILDCLPFFAAPTGWTLSMCFMNYSSSSQASLAIAEITILLSSLFVSPFPSFRRPVTIMHNLREYWSASSSCWVNIVLTL